MRKGNLNSDELELELIDLVKPWLPDAEIDEVNIQETCGCYSEYTTDPPSFDVTYKALGDPPYLQRLLNIIEPLVEQWAKRKYDFQGCECCQGEEYEATEPLIWVRIIPK